MPENDYRAKCFQQAKDSANKSVCDLICDLIPIRKARLWTKQRVTKVFKCKTTIKEDKRLLGIRDIFQLTFLIALLLFVALIVTSWRMPN